MLASLVLALFACAPGPPAPEPGPGTREAAQPSAGDSLEAAAFDALGPRPPEYVPGASFPPLRLRDFQMTDPIERRMRTGVAVRLVAQANDFRRLHGIDSLPPYLEALRVDPTCLGACEHAASILLHRGALERAHALVALGLRIEARSAVLWTLLGKYHEDRAQYEAARSALERAIALDRSHVPNAYELLAESYLNQGQPARAESVLASARGGIAAWISVYARAVAAHQRGELQSAQTALEEAARDPAAAAAVLVELGCVEMDLGHLNAAERSFERALEKSPREHAALSGVGRVQRARGEVERAAATFARLVAALPADSLAQFNLAGASLDAAWRARRGARADSFYAIAEKAFGVCVHSNFRAAESRERRAEIRLQRGDAAGASEDARVLLGDPKHAAEARMLLARAAVVGHDPAAAVQHLAPDFETDALGLDGLDLLGEAYLQLDRPRDAARVLRRAHERQPQDWRTAMNFGVALSRSGDLEEAESVLRAVVEQRPQDPDALQNLAAVLQRRGRHTDALRLKRQADRLRSQ